MGFTGPLADQAGLEPATGTLQRCCSIQLSHWSHPLGGVLNRGWERARGTTTRGRTLRLSTNTDRGVCSIRAGLHEPRRDEPSRDVLYGAIAEACMCFIVIS